MFGGATDPGHTMHMRAFGVLFLIVGLVYVAKGMNWLAFNLPDFWALLVLLFGLMMVSCAGCYAPKM